MNRFLIVAAGLSIPVAHAAAAPVYEPFDYAVGKLTGNTNPTAPANSNGFANTNVWSLTGTAATNGPDVIGGNLSYPNLVASVGSMGQLSGNGLGLNANRIAIPDHAAGSTVYFSMIVQVPTGTTDFGSSTTSGSFFTGLQYHPDSIGGMEYNSNASAAVLTVHADTAGDGYELGIGFRDTAGARVFDTTKRLAGETLFLVGKYEIGVGNQDDVASLFINPDLSTGLEPGVPTVLSANNATSGIYDYFYSAAGTQLETNIRSFILRNNGVEPDHMNVDELRIGDSWAEVTPVPEPAGLTALGLGALGLLARHRRGA